MCGFSSQATKKEAKPVNLRSMFYLVADSTITYATIMLTLAAGLQPTYQCTNDLFALRALDYRDG